MTSKEIISNLNVLVANFNKEEFIYDLLLAYGSSKTSVLRLKKGDFNMSDTEGETLYKNKLFYAHAATDLHLRVDAFAKEERILKQKPRFIIVTDHQLIVAKDLKTNVNIDIPLLELPSYYDFFLPLSGAEVYRSKNDNKADREASYQLARLYDILVQDNPDYAKESHLLNLFLSRLLFCFFAEDTDIFDKVGIFTDTLAQHTQANGADVHEFLNELFTKLDTENGDFPKHLQNFPYVNGGLFRDSIKAPIFTTKSRRILLECGNLDWSEINPDIFGSMIQAVADPEERSDLGMHYTSVPNIKKLIEPLFLNALNKEFEKQHNSISGLNKLIARLGSIKFFDPACGSGNFLIITYKEIRLLEIEVIKRIAELSIQQGLTLPMQFTSIQLSQFYGIEIKDFAHEMAILSLWLAEHQMNKVFDDRLEGLGQSKPILPLKQAGNIACGNATRMSWEKVCPRGANDEIYILGNPPYLGSRNQDSNQKDDMQLVFGRDFKSLDYVTAWFYKGAKYIEGYDAQLAFVATNSICQGLAVALTWPRILNKNIEISFAHQSFKWTNNARGNAGVTVINVGLRNKSNQPKYLFTNITKEVKNINGYLLDAADSYIDELPLPLSKFRPMMKGNAAIDDGNFLFSTEEQAKAFKIKYPEQAYLVREFIGSQELINSYKRYCLWLKDAKPTDILNNPEIQLRVENVKRFRNRSPKTQTRKYADKPLLFMEDRQPDSDYLMIPVVSSENREYIPIGFLTKDVIANYSSFILPNATALEFGIIHSKMHMVWVSAVGGKLKTDYRYSAKLCYNTFPFPETTAKQKTLINEYVYDIMDERAKFPEKTMAWLYNPDTMPSGLRQAHKALDLAIEQIYRLAPFENDAERLAYLFKLYEEMTKKDTLFAKVKKTRGKKV
ncbi:class I SAM-dependent DNA methyltransferase [Pedobacter sp. SD-b]|uniref:site-specific DNA-methyltransferase (adenine-specific) n=1 Tax=Pedobacter segetis TaxID=2793069 RepID=A0ABS1BKP5_9SPHI|nr:class I SAM-dependent DNA methyltransferase [Pedobacter segetis]MBK0383316.1 class I SAM-dependent DNA methyltransferase [Pedobacter segetis]